MKKLCTIALVGAISLLLSCNNNLVKTTYDSGKTLEKYRVNGELKEGKYRIYHENRRLAFQTYYSKGLEEGTRATYYENGRLESEINLSAGIYEGPFRYYHPNGTIKQEGYYSNDFLQGELKTYYKNGLLKEVVLFVGGLTQGNFVEYHPNGQIRTKGNYSNDGSKDGLESGELKEYDEGGQLMRTSICKMGDCCPTWDQENGDIEPNSDFCKAIINGE